MEKLENKSTGNKRGKTPFHVDAKRGKLIIKSIDNNISSDMYGVTHFQVYQLISEAKRREQTHRGLDKVNVS